MLLSVSVKCNINSSVLDFNSPAGAAGDGGTKRGSGATAGSGTGAGDTGSIGG